MTATARVRARRTHGSHLWGRLTVHPVSRTMWSSRELVVFAPGTNTRERLLLRAWHAWVVVGALVAVGVMAATVDTPVVGMLTGVTVYVGGFLVLGRATRRLRMQVRSVMVTTYHGNGRPEVHGDTQLLSASLDALTILERALEDGQIDRVDFELVWGDVWNALPTRRNRPDRST